MTIYGDAGVGKSRLTHEFVEWTEGLPMPPVVLRGRCLPYGDGITYWPLAEILKSHAGSSIAIRRNSPVEKVRKSAVSSSRRMSRPTRARHRGARLHGRARGPRHAVRECGPARRARRAARGVAIVLHGARGVRAVITVVEDIHGPTGMLDLLEELAERVDGPAMFLCPSRPDLSARRPGWGGGRRNASSVALDPLSSEQAETLVRLLLTVDDLPVTVRARMSSKRKATRSTLRRSSAA